MAPAPDSATEKVGAFIIRRRQGNQADLLIFHHSDMPEVPAQIPGGTIEPDGETPEEAVRREVSEETGLDQFALIRKLGVSRWFWAERQIWIQRHVFLLEAPASTADRWTHVVTGSGEDNQLRFACLWIKPTKEFRLGGGLDLFLTGGYLPELFAE